MNVADLPPYQREFLLGIAQVIKLSKLRPERESEIDQLINELRTITEREKLRARVQ
jgi:hypothetical protein